jgi:hypothetical protein
MPWTALACSLVVALDGYLAWAETLGILAKCCYLQYLSTHRWSFFLLARFLLIGGLRT